MATRQDAPPTLDTAALELVPEAPGQAERRRLLLLPLRLLRLPLRVLLFPLLVLLRLLRRLDFTLIFPAAVTLGVMLWGMAAPSYWRDETATLSADNRTIPQLLRMLGTIDVVHGWYYLLLWPVTHFVGTNAFDTRLPSAIAMALAAFGIAAIGRRVRSRRAGLYAGLAFAALPLVGLQGHDARPYAFETAAAVLASYLLVRAAEKPTWGRFAAYGVSMVNLGYMHMFGLLIIPAHAIALVPAARLAQHRRAEAGTKACEAPDEDVPVRARVLFGYWLAAIDFTLIFMTPVIFLGWQQQKLISWLPAPSGNDVSQLTEQFAAGTLTTAIIFGVIALLGIVRTDWPDKFRWPGSRPATAPRLPRLWAWARRQDCALTLLAVPWLVLPPTILLVTSQFKPVYEIMYVEYCLPAAALLIGAGIAAIGWPVRFVVVLVLAMLGLPFQEAIRQPLSGGYIRSTAEFIGANKLPGDAVYYPQGPSSMDLAYPQDFTGLRQIQLYETPVQNNGLMGTSLPTPVIEKRLRDVSRLWVVEESQTWIVPQIPLYPKFRHIITWHRNQMWVRLYVRVPPRGQR